MCVALWREFLLYLYQFLAELSFQKMRVGGTTIHCFEWNKGSNIYSLEFWSTCFTSIEKHLWTLPNALWSQVLVLWVPQIHFKPVGILHILKAFASPMKHFRGSIYQLMGSINFWDEFIMYGVIVSLPWFAYSARVLFEYLIIHLRNTTVSPLKQERHCFCRNPKWSISFISDHQSSKDG